MGLFKRKDKPLPSSFRQRTGRWQKRRQSNGGCLFISINIDKEPIPWFKVIGPSSRIYHVVSKIAKLFIHDALGPSLISISISMRWMDINRECGYAEDFVKGIPTKLTGAFWGFFGCGW